ncbi:hypothetical protein [Coraliomargarita akajimensis]|uniref:Carrier domain-containing protein n=1 Tax=Coraliomargarita akajimensis (strain DSM 45221 / IAM 15411 / JCM 23193 / KCTC 12865 / 04OKA010-24) TaxID=583355 RepID=D5ENB8_CORAD|nr:hypothetical protein [Coraliomargarita akajimensis]ADE55394.1 conserved hypothetical protein [Coraliomargarita akajimensis DSM 45221]
MPSKQEIETLVLETVSLLAKDFEIPTLETPNSDSLLFGPEAPLDSMALVNLIADLEDATLEAFGASITLADEKAMSARTSPFKDVQSITAAIAERL